MADRLVIEGPFCGIGADTFGQTQPNEEFFLGVVSGGGWRFQTITLDIFLDALDVLPASRAIEGMRIGAEAEVRLESPILQVVFGFQPRTRKIRNLVAENAHAFQACDRDFI